MFYATWWSLLPPAIAIVLAFILKDVYLSLFLGIVTAGLLASGFHPWAALETVVSTMNDSLDLNVFIFDVLLGMIIVLLIKSGGVCGDHLSPISDTTIMSSAGAQSDHMNHVRTQIQYAMVVCVVSVAGYLLAALTRTWIIPLAAGAVMIVLILMALRKRTQSAMSGARA